MVQISIQITEEQAKTLKVMAKVRKVSVAKLVQENITLFLAAHPNEMSYYDEKRKRALIGIRKIKELKFRDIEGKTDVSINHDKYLDDIYAA